MLKENKIFLAIIIASIIIGGCVYSALRNNYADNTQRTRDVFLSRDQNPPIIEKQNNTPEIKTENVAITAVCGAENNTIVTKVIDGDTVVVEGGFHVRLLGIDADEKGYSCYEQAKNRLENLILNKQVVLEKDKTDLDQYGRCLRYIFLSSEEDINNTNVDVQLVKEGLAVARFYAPDLKYKSEITLAEKQAQQNGAGCKWSATKSQ